MQQAFLSLVQSSLCLLHDGCESSGIMNCHFGQALTVQLNAGLLHTVHKGGVVQTEGSDSSAQTGNPHGVGCGKR